MITAKQAIFSLGICWSATFFTAVFLATGPPVSAQSGVESVKTETAANAFPDSTIVYLEIQHPAQLIKKLLEHPLRDDIEELTFVKQALDDDQLKYLPIVFGLIKGKTGMEWDELLCKVTEKGVYFCVDEATGGGALLIHSGSAEKLKEIAGLALGMAKSDAQSNDREPPYKLSEYRGHKVAEFDGGLMARIDDWLLFSNKPKLAKRIADNLLDGTSRSLANNDEFTELRNRKLQDGASEDVWAYVDLESVRARRKNDEIFSGKTNDAGAELLIGGILEALAKSSQAFFGASLGEEDLKLTASLPFDSSRASDRRNFFFGADGKSLAPKRLAVADTLADVVAYRDIAEWWNSKEELFNENVIAQLAQADSQLSTLFAGLDFGEDILGQLKPGVQIISKLQRYSSEYQPDVKVPAFAIIGRLQDPKIQRRLRISYKSFIGFMNIQLGMEGQPQLDSESKEFEGGKIESASYLIDDESPDGLILYNFSPSIAFKDDYFIISSTSDLARELLGAIGKTASDSTDSNATETLNTGMWLEAQQIGIALRQNKEALIVQNMIEDGNDREAAEQTIEGLLEIVGLLKSAEMTFADDDGHLKLEIEVKFNNDRR